MLGTALEVRPFHGRKYHANTGTFFFPSSAVVTCTLYLIGQGELCHLVTVDGRLHYLTAGDLPLTRRSRSG